MIFKRAVVKLRAQDWMAISIELAIVVLGVFIGTQVSNWNAERLERQDNARVLGTLKPEIANMVANFASIDAYYDTGHRYAQTAFGGWRRDPKIGDADFVIGALQASQIYYTGLNNDTWSQIYGSDRLRTIDDPAIRKDLSLLMTTDYAAMERDLFSAYRQHVREVIPADVQEAIEAQCGERAVAGTVNRLFLPPICNFHYPQAKIASAAASLRAHPELVYQLNWHLSAIANYRLNVGGVDKVAKDLLSRLK